MGSRDHSETCANCGFERGGMNDLSCACDHVGLAEVIADRDRLAAEVERLTKERDGFRTAVGELAHDRTANSDTLYQQYREMEAQRDRARAEVDRLTVCLKRANSNHEEFERKWYLVQDENTRLAARVRELEAALAERSR